jgi:hypothetical protein
MNNCFENIYFIDKFKDLKMKNLIKELWSLLFSCFFDSKQLLIKAKR